MVRHVINLDWLELMCSGPLVMKKDDLTVNRTIEPGDPGAGPELNRTIECAEEKYEFDRGNIVLAKKTLGTSIFKYSYEVYLKGKLFGTAHVCPRSPEIMKPDWIQFRVENNVLYELGALDDVKYFLQKMSWQVVNVTRVDIALDGVQVLNIADRWANSELVKLGKAKMHLYFTGKRVIQGFDVGSRSSDKWITGYNKSDELEVSNKDYIKKYWVRCGLDVSQPVERLELKLRNSEIKKIIDFQLWDLDNFEYLASVFRSCMKNFFEFVTTAEHEKMKNVSRMQRMEFICWDCIGAQLLDRLSTQKTNEVYRMKQAAKTAFWCYLASGQKYYADIAQEMAMNVNSIEWYMARVDRWKDEYEKRCGHNRDGLISFQYFLNFEQYDPNTQLKLFEKA